MAVNQQQRLFIDLLEPVIEAKGFQLWGIELQTKPRRTLLRVYIESQDGISVDDCALVSRELVGVLDVEDPIAGAYDLEVSSPGVERPLFNIGQYKAYIGRKLKIKSRRLMDNQRRFKGELLSINATESSGSVSIELKCDGKVVMIGFNDIDRCNVLADW